MPRADAFLCRIGYAEEWLRRARRDWREGDAPGAVRRLMLAEAEIRNARESGAAPDAPELGRPHRAGGWRLVAGLAAAAMIAAGIGYASMWTAAPPGGVAARGGVGGPPPDGSGGTIVQLDSGRFLTLDPGRESTDTAAGPGFTAPAPSAGGAPGGPAIAGAGSPGGRLVPGPARVGGVPVDLRTSSPTF